MTQKKSLEPLLTRNFTLYKPHPAQQRVHKELCKKDPNFKIVTVCSGRQAGKTLLAQNQLVYWAVKNPKSLLWFVSPTDAQCMKVYRSMVFALIPVGLVTKHTGNPGNISIQFSNGSLLEFKSAASEDSLRGQSINYLVVDEAAYIKKKTFEEVLMPTLSVKGKRVLILSTPKGKGNFFYEYFTKGLEGDKSFKSFKFLSSDNPLANKEFIEVARRTMPEATFRQEFLGSFEDSAQCFAGAEDCIVANPTEGKRYYLGIDIGLLNDRTIAVVMNESYQVVYIEKLYRTTAQEVKNKIQSLYSRFKISKGYIEVNGQGLPIFQDLRGRGLRVEGFTTTQASKSRIINQLIHAVAEKSIGIPNDEELLNEMSNFVLTYGPTGKERFGNGEGSAHDDMVVALALALEAAKAGRRAGGNIFSVSFR